MSRCNLPRPYYTETPLSLYHLTFDSPTHSAIQRLALSILFFLSFFLTHTHATSQMGSIVWKSESSWADTLTASEKLIPSSQEKNWTNERLLRVTNQASPLTAGSRENTDRGAGKKETDERKSATPGGNFPSYPVFPLAFSPTKASCIIKQNVQLGNEGDRYREREIQVSLQTNYPITAAWKTKRDRGDDDESCCLTRNRPGNTCRWRRQSSPQGWKEVWGGRLWRRGGSVSLRGESGAHAVQRCRKTQPFPSFHIL